MRRIDDRTDSVKPARFNVPPAVFEATQTRIENEMAKLRAAGHNPSVITAFEADKILKS